MGGLTKSRVNTTFSSELWPREVFSNDVRNSERMPINIPNKICQANRTLLVYLREQKEKFFAPAISFIFFDVVIWGFLWVNFEDLWRRLIFGSRCFPLPKSFPLLAKAERPRKTLLTGYLFCRWYETLRTIFGQTFKSPHPHPPIKNIEEGSCAFGASSRINPLF